MKKNNKKDTINLFFSAFLVTAYVICSFFFSQLAATMSPVLSSIVNILIYSVFGLILFYATRVGEGKQVMRFSPMTLVFLVIPAFYIMLAYLIPAMPFGDQIVENSLIVAVASVAFGYGLPYTFLSGYELAQEEEADAEANEEQTEALTEEETASEDSDEEAADENSDDNPEEQESEEISEYSPEEEQEILAEQDMLDAENNAEEAALYYSKDEENEADDKEKTEKVD